LNRGGITVENFSAPQVSDHIVLVQVAYSFISSGTEVATINASQDSLVKRLVMRAPRYAAKVAESLRDNGVEGTISLVKGHLKQLLALGYSCSGQVIAVGKKVTRFSAGDYVACAGAGMASHAEFVAVPENLMVRLASDKHLKQASVTTIGAIAMQGVRRADVRFGEVVCVMGLGLIGQLTAQLLRHAGCTVIGVDIIDSRLEAAQKCGAHHVFNAQDVKLEREINFITEHYGVDATIITAGSSSGALINQAMEITRRRGTVVLVGDVKLDFDREVFYKKEIDFRISCSYGPGRYDEQYEKRGIDYPYAYVRWTENRNMQLFVRLVERDEIAIDPIIEKEFELEQAQEAYTFLKERMPLGVVLTYSHAKEESSKREYVPSTDLIPFEPPRGVLCVGMIGFGGFAQVKLLPIIRNQENVHIAAVVDIDPALALNGSTQNGAQYATNMYEEVLEDNDIKMVVIATPHALHARQTIDCLKAGKAVFAEKPAACTWDELEELTALCRNNSNILYAVDFNRSFAPFITAVKEVVASRVSPLVITYRMNAGFIPPQHWIQQQGGRIIGEACHIFELFSSLVDAPPKSVSVGVLQPSRDDVGSTDNVSVDICYADGSLCNLVYTAIGNTKLAKERMEVFFDGKSIVMDDFKKLTGYGLPLSFNRSSGEQDKGHRTLLSLFIRAVKEGRRAPISFERIESATRISLLVDELAREGGGSRLLNQLEKKETNEKDVTFREKEKEVQV